MTDDQISLVKQANDIVAVIGEYVNLTRQGRVFKGLCPFHDDHKPSLSVDPVRQSYKCWPCDAGGDVIDFVMRRERIAFPEALEQLARRANIELKPGDRTAARGRQQLLDLMQWAAEAYHSALFDAAHRRALTYLLEKRGLTPPIVEQFQLGYAPSGDWLHQKARRAAKPLAALVELGLCGESQRDGSPYDRFGDRIIFPIRDVRGRTVGLGGRILPDSPNADKKPKYYNSAETLLFSKSRNLYGIDQARAAAEKAGYLAVVEGYTDVLMAHQAGVLPVVAALGTALNEHHIGQLRKFVGRVVLVFDADAGGEGGVQRALRLFISHEVELAVAALPAGQDPCDFLAAQGGEAFRERLTQAQDALDFTLARAFAGHGDAVEGRWQAIEQVLQIVAEAPAAPRAGLAIKRDLVLNRLAQRAGVTEERIRRRLGELQSGKKSVAEPVGSSSLTPEEPQPFDKLERELVQVLLVQPALVPLAREKVALEEVGNDKRRRVLHELYQLAAEGTPITLDALRVRLADQPGLAETLARLWEDGQRRGEPRAWLTGLLAGFAQRKAERQTQAVRGRLKGYGGQGPVPVELLRELQQAKAGGVVPPV